MNALTRNLSKLIFLLVLVCPAARLQAQFEIPKRVDTTGVRKDSLAFLPTVPDTILKLRLAKLQKDVPLTYHSAVQAYVDYFTFRRAGYTQTMLERVPLFFPLYERMLADYELPDELKYLSIVESSLNPRAVSHSGAGGLWQFMPGTGRDLKLAQDDYVDERMDPVKATEAACKYLRDLYAIFGDWEMALAAYNCGPGAVKRAMRRTGGSTYYAIYDALPKETRGYVPQFVAFTYLMNHAADHGIVGEKFEYPIPNDTIQVTGYFNLEKFAKHSNIPVADLQKINPAVTTGILPEYTSRYPLRVPRKQFSYFASHRRAIMDSARVQPYRMEHTLLATSEDVRYGTDSMGGWAAVSKNPLARAVQEGTVAPATVLTEAISADEPEEDLETVVYKKPKQQTYVVKKGDNLADIADHYGLDVYDLKRWNHLSSSTVHQGQKLSLLREADETHSERMAEQGTVKALKKAEVVAKTKQYKPRYHRVQDGDTLWNIAQRYDGLTIDRLKKMNHIKTNSLRPGQKLIVG